MADDSNLDLEPQDAGLAFRAEMWATDLLFRNWKQIVGAVVVVLVGVGAYGIWNNFNQSSQRATTSAIADIEAALPQDMMTLALAKAGVRPDATIDEAAVREAAGKLIELSRGASGTAAVEAALKAGELYRFVDDAAGRREALEVASNGASGVLRYAAVAGLANLDIEEGKPDEALARFRELRTEQPYLARQATLDLAAALESLDRHNEAVAAYDEYLATWPEASDVEDVRQRRTSAAGKSAATEGTATGNGG